MVSTKYNNNTFTSWRTLALLPFARIAAELNNNLKPIYYSHKYGFPFANRHKRKPLFFFEVKNKLLRLADEQRLKANSQNF